MGSCESSKNNENNERKEIYLPGEQYFNKVTDINPNMSPYSNNNRDKVDLFFSLINIVQPNNTYSFSISIINNVKINILTYLGDVENRTGNNIEFGKSFSVDYYFQREQCLIIESKINGTDTGIKRNIVLSDLIRSPDNKLDINFEGIGLLIVNFKIKKIRETPSQNQISSFQFSFHLKNKILENYNSNFFYFI